ncbi:pollen-specific leucine-rich repeat extensin-like protein 4 isoform X1 [Hyalella azteca]|uniref:Pollen-specific leucine-rich repeat extensin-like protein 4 isoform X1 n=1 Tax=Hyalella azteca TaxID=294128 RepID=A0A8B7PNF7_HYAAZ|nr:pollen-specific leucine-rich repeat extensin-like protein 4 isoform X1 [Hyalella azteca]
MRGGVGPMRLGGRIGMRPSPYDHMPVTDRYGGPPMPPMADRYGPLPPPAPRNSYYDDYDESLRRPLPMERRPLPPPRDPYMRDPYDRYDPYDRIPPAPRSAVLMERRIAPLPYDRRPDPYADLYRERDPYAPRDPYAIRRSMSPRRYAGPPRDLPPAPPRRF